MKAIASFAVAALVAASALAVGPAKKGPSYSGDNLSLSLGVGFPTADTKDFGVNTMFMAGLDYALGAMGDGTNAKSFVGIGGLWGSGDSGFKTTSYGIHYGFMFGLGDANAAMPLAVKVKAGYYSSKIQGEGDVTKGGFGGSASLVWESGKGKKGGFTVEAGYYFMPSVEGVNNTGYFVAFGIPLGGK